MQHGKQQSPKSVEETTVTRDAQGMKTGEKTIVRNYRYDDDPKPIDILAVAMVSLFGGALITLAVIKLAAQMI